MTLRYLLLKYLTIGVTVILGVGAFVCLLFTVLVIGAPLIGLCMGYAVPWWFAVAWLAFLVGGVVLAVAAHVVLHVGAEIAMQHYSHSDTVRDVTNNLRRLSGRVWP